MPPISVRPYDLANLPELLTLAQAALGSAPATPMTPEFWRWKHLENPAGPSLGQVAWDGGAPVALRVLMRWSFVAPGGATVAAVRAVDTATHPAYRRQGLFSRLTRQAVEQVTAHGVALIYNTPNSQSLPGYLKLGWQPVTRWPIYLCPLRPLRMVARRLGRQPAPSPADHAAYFGPLVLTWAEFDRCFAGRWERLAARWEQSRPRCGLRTDRSPAYWRWRYGGHPHLVYGVLPLVEEDRLLAFAVLRPNRRMGWQEVVLADLAVASPAYGPRLLRALRHSLAADYCAAHFAKPAVEARWLRRNGFLPVPRQGMRFVVRPLQPDATTWTAPEAWDLTLGDLELF
jgi:GNAT superfamily N-acetyltransferase